MNPPKGKSKKKPGKSGYWIFCTEYMDQRSKQCSMQEAQEAAAKIWDKMTIGDRQPYKAKAALERNNFSRGNLTSQGVEVDQIQKENEEREQLLNDMKNDINRIIKSAKLSETLPDEKFFLIHINHLFYHPGEDRHYLCEIAVVCFTLREGVLNENVFHKLIRPGLIPTGYYHDAKQHSAETHKLLESVYNHSDNNDKGNGKEVFYAMISFLKNITGSEDLPPLYSNSDCMNLCENVAKWYSEELKLKIPFKIYNLQYMFFTLRNFVANKNVWPSETFSFGQIEQDIYAYNSNGECSYHKAIAQPLYCSRSIVVRYAYIICDNCCGDLGIRLIRSQHIPRTANIDAKKAVVPDRKPRKTVNNDVRTRPSGSASDLQSDEQESLSASMQAMSFKENPEDLKKNQKNMNKRFEAMNVRENPSQLQKGKNIMNRRFQQMSLKDNSNALEKDREILKARSMSTKVNNDSSSSDGDT